MRDHVKTWDDDDPRIVTDISRQGFTKLKPLGEYMNDRSNTDSNDHSNRNHSSRNVTYSNCVEHLKNSYTFRNPYGLQSMMYAFGIKDIGSFICNDEYDPTLYYDHLRSTQNRSWASKIVEDGVILAKDGKTKDAISMYNTAIEVDPMHADAYVARGAANFNLRLYKDAVEDFNVALEIDPNHINAKTYLDHAMKFIDKETTKRSIDTVLVDSSPDEDSRANRHNELHVRESTRESIRNREREEPGDRRKRKRERSRDRQSDEEEQEREDVNPIERRRRRRRIKEIQG
eukprot:TRINITY_DN2738_c0_g1_i2.p1 TRINITY_DN2738_c0_g1~~TRINITY_DN2738_c0_g1_i2.p1  ORF type:complete len:319 (+),score=44.99 TRINITY_DN2738_c0_g1_i2:94-957(+)